MLWAGTAKTTRGAPKKQHQGITKGAHPSRYAPFVGFLNAEQSDDGDGYDYC